MTQVNVGEAAKNVVEGIIKEGGKFVRQGDKVFVLFHGRRIEIGPDFNNHSYAALQIKHCGKGTVEYAGRAICQRVAVMAGETASKVRLAKFSALSKAKDRLYLPTSDNMLLEITSMGLKLVPNGDNLDSLWVEHPKNDAFKFNPSCSVREALGRFKELCVDSQSCSESHAWFVAMHEGLLPYVREFAKSRMLVEHLGPSQQGKTTGAQRHTKLHGLGDVLGDVTAAYFRNSCDEIGLAVLDNKEHDDQSRDLIQLLLFAATGAQNGRSMQDGTAREMKDRPIVVLTSIEGVFKQELQKRVLYIKYGVRLTNSQRDRDSIEDQITRERDELLSGLCHVLRRFLGQNLENIRTKLGELENSPFGDFTGYITAIVRLLHAFGAEAGYPTAWAENIIKNWFQTLGSANESEGDELEMHVFNVLELYEAVREKSELMDLSPQHKALFGCFEREANYYYKDESGTLYISTVGKLLNAMTLNKIGSNAIPKTQGMGRRLEKAKWSSLKVLDEHDDIRLKRKSHKKPIGIFRPSEDETCDDAFPISLPIVAGANDSGNSGDVSSP